MSNLLSEVKFDRGTIVVSEKLMAYLENHLGSERTSQLGIQSDLRTEQFRAPAYRYGKIRKFLAPQLQLTPVRAVAGDIKKIQLRDYQKMSLDAWVAAGCRGVVCLPTGAGKSLVGVAAILTCGLPAMVMAPTRILMDQWVGVLSSFLDCEIGKVGDGHFELQNVTVATYESAYRHMARIGNRFGLIIADETHHFGGGIRDEALEMSIAPFRLGLTATLPSDQVRLNRIVELIGNIVIEIDMDDLVGSVLAPYKIIKMPISLNEREWRDYQIYRKIYVEYFASLRHAGGVSGAQASFKNLTMKAMQDPTGRGRAAITAWKKAQSITRLCEGKQGLIESLLSERKNRSGIVFADRALDAYGLAARYGIAALTGEIGRAEREKIIAAFLQQTIRCLVTCKVLNEGFDLPEAEFAIVTSPSTNSIERRQRLGRLLRKHGDKSALLIELYCRGTHEHRRLNAGERDQA